MKQRKKTFNDLSQLFGLVTLDQVIPVTITEPTMIATHMHPINRCTCDRCTGSDIESYYNDNTIKPNAKP